ncbi:hypothetical protein [Spirulina sp. 06S082]|uniref:hypothetical protein n=1 Tax=Spirulina sp. 06S082 TaxID=3110248 RepID=UPI002B2020A3|nr:hypothetical protein [Spirulina sp. 06S082]MEA5472192.1 hypothetical protein [Spirulina sp. 06S082]
MKLFSLVLSGSLWFLGQVHAIAQTCTAQNSCVPPRLQFTPGQTIRVEVINRTAIPIELQQLGGTDAMIIFPAGMSPFFWGGTIKPNLSLIFWDPEGGKLILNASQIDDRLLQVEILPGGRIEGDSAIYLHDDGRIEVF